MERIILLQNDNLLKQKRQFSKYSIKEVCEIMTTDKKVDEDILVSH